MTLWELLPNRTRVGNGWQPPLPLILGAWHDTPDLQKVLRLSEHIKWASSNHALDSVAQYLRALPEVEWHHVGD
jgi:hypothetical protein